MPRRRKVTPAIESFWREFEKVLKRYFGIVKNLLLNVKRDTIVRSNGSRMEVRFGHNALRELGLHKKVPILDSQGSKVGERWILDYRHWRLDNKVPNIVAAIDAKLAVAWG